MQGVRVVRKQHRPVNPRGARRTIGGGIGQNTEVVGLDRVIVRQAHDAEPICTGCNTCPLPLVRWRVLRRWVSNRGDRNI